MFGNIENGQMVLNELGKEAKKIWDQIPKHFSHVHMDEYVFMPNHMHGIIMIGSVRRDAIYRDAINRDAINGVSTQESKPKSSGIVSTDKNPMLNDSLSTIIRWYKGRTTYEIDKLIHKKFQWQARFYDHVIRNDADLDRVREYIGNNPLNWELDEENVDRIQGAGDKRPL
jgi:REP element-mobilizing transposase RayT